MVSQEKKTEYSPQRNSRRYVLSVLVDNQAGVLSRVSGLFSRRGFNIDSLTVGETSNSGVSRMTIVVTGDEYVLEQIIKQLSKLVEVISIQHCQPHETVMRELALIKVGVDGTKRPQVLETANIYRARIVDVSVDSVVIEVTGSEDKVASLIRLLEPIGIRELVRTGLTAMGRGGEAL
ncbi:MAG: acetolactate synthase small subunit [Treponemataceae bacterium]|nr:MAG: acetolactate synthase small subunit [Treponemataceae bacterium]